MAEKRVERSLKKNAGHTPPVQKDVVIIGAGASGLICAIEAGKRGRAVLVLEHMGSIGKKIRVSGGGRCNFTNSNLRPDHYLSVNPHFCRSALSRFTPQDFIGMVERHGIAYHEKENGRLFCRDTSGDILRMLSGECRNAGVEIRVNCRIDSITKSDHFIISTSFGKVDAAALVIATGGLSYPALGATDFGYRIARKFGMKVTSLRPALVPLIFSPQDHERFGGLSGVSFDATVSHKGREFRGEVLFTHRGLSGPAILQVSSYWTPGDEITIDVMPETDMFERFMAKRRRRITLGTLLSEYLPKRFANRWCELHVPSGPMCQYTEKELRDIAHAIHHWAVRPAGTGGYKSAEITAGGVDTGGLSSKTMEARNVPGLYFIGEVVDVAGQLGGYNLQWAWSSGFVAGQYV